MRVTFAGHSLIPSKNQIRELIKEQLQQIIAKEEHVTFYLGGIGDFDTLCADICRELRMEHHKIELVYISPYFTSSEQKKIKKMQEIHLYDASIYPPIERVPPKFAILKRNEWMIENSDIVIAYVNCGHGGAYRSLRIAKRKNKPIINIYDQCHKNK